MKIYKETAGRKSFSDPTPDEIRRACEAIQKSWTPRERRQRAAAAHNAVWRLPVVSVRLPSASAAEQCSRLLDTYAG
jgi:hypothetical protein